MCCCYAFFLLVLPLNMVMNGRALLLQVLQSDADHCHASCSNNHNILILILLLNFRLVSSHSLTVFFAIIILNIHSSSSSSQRYLSQLKRISFHFNMEWKLEQMLVKSPPSSRWYVQIREKICMCVNCV